MEFAALKRRELQALCKRHGLAAGGTNAALVARLTAALTGSGGAAEEAVGVVVGKGCMKRSPAGASGGDLDAAKRVTFELEEAEVGVTVTGRGCRRSQVLTSPAVTKTRGRHKAGEAPPAAKGTRSQAAAGDSADESDSGGEAGADAPVSRSGRNAVNLGAGDGAGRVVGAVTRKNSDKAEQEEADIGDAVGRKHQLKRKTRENDIEDVDVSGQVGVSRRSTRSSGILFEPDALSSPVEKKRGRRKTADVKAKTCVDEQPTEALQSGRTLRSGVVLVAPAPPIVSESKKNRCKVQEEEPAVEKVAKAEMSGRTTRSSSVAPVPPIVSKSKKSRGKVQEEEPAVEKVAKAEISGRATRSSSVAPVPPIVSESKKSRGKVQEEEPAVEKVAKAEISGRTTRSSSVAPAVASPRVISKKRGRKTDDVQSDGGPNEKMENKRQSSRPTTRGSIHHLASSGDEASLEQVAAPSKGLPLRRSRQNPSEANMMLKSSTTSESSNWSRAPTELNGPKIPRPTMLNAANDGVEDGVEKPDRHLELKKSKLWNVSARVARNGGEIPFSESSGKASATDIQIKVSGPVRRSTRQSVVPTSLEHETSGMREDVEKKQTVTKPVGRSTRRSVASVILEKESKGLTKEIVPEAHVKRPPTRKSVVPAMLEKGRKSIITEIIPEAHVKRPMRTPVCKSVVPNVVNKENKDHNEFVRSEEPSVKTRSAHTRLHDALQNDESLQRTTRKSSKLVISPSQSKPTVSKGRPAKRRRTSSLQEDMPEEQKEDQLAYEAHTNDVIEVATSTALEIGVLPFAAEKTDLQDSQLNSEVEGIVVVESGAARDEDDREILEIEMDGTVGTTEKPPSIIPIPDCKDVGTISEEVVRSTENDAGRCSPNFGQSPTEPQFLFSQGIAEKSATHNAIPCSVNCVEESDVHKVKCQIETVVPSKFESYHGSDENSVRVEESGGCTFSSQQNNEQEVFSCSKDLVASAQLDLSENVDHVIRDVDVITEDLVCKEEEKKDFIPSDINVPHQISHANERAENASGVSGAVICISQSTSISYEVNSDSSQLESQDALNNCIASSSTEVVQQDNEEEHNLHNGVTHGIHVSVMSEAAQVEVSKSEEMLLPDVKTSAFRDAQLNSKREGNKFEEHRFSCGRDGSGENNMSQLVNEYVMDSCQDQELKLPHDLSAFKSPKGSTTCQDEFVVGSGFGPNIVSNIATDAPGTAKLGDNLSPSETALLRSREKTPSCKIDAPELSSDHLFPMDSSARAVQSLSGRLREAGLAMGNSDNKLHMEQVQQDDVQEGTLENTAQGSATLESNQQCGLSEQAEPHSLKKSSSIVEQSQFVHQSVLPQDDVHEQDGTQEKASPGSVTPECKQKCGLPDEEDEHPLNNERCSTSVEQSTFGLPLLFSQERIEEPSENVALAVHAKNGVDESKDIHVGYGVEKTPVPESSSVDFSAFSKSEDCVYTCDEGNEYEGLTKSCHEQEQMTCQPNLLEAANCMKDFTNPDKVSDGENNKPVHSTYISSSYEKIGANRPVKHASVLGDGLLCSSLIASTNDTDVHPSSNPYQFESTDILDELKGCSSTEALQQGLKEQCEAPKESQVTYRAYPSDMIEASTAEDLESEVPPLPAEETSDMLLEYLSLGEPSKGSGMHGDLVLPSAENEDEQLISPLLATETSALLDEQANPELELGESEKCNYSSEDPSGKIGSGYVKNTIVQLHEDLHMDPIHGKELQNDLPAPKSPEHSTAGQDAETSPLPDDQPNPESENCNFSSEDTGGKNGTGYVKNTLFQYPIQGKELSSDLPAPKSHEQSTAGQDEETSSLPDDQPNPESEKCNYSSEDTSGKIGSGYVENTIVQLHEDLHMDPIQGKELLNDLPAPKSPEQSTAGQDAETSALPDDQPNPESEKCNFSSEDTGGKNGTGYVKNTLFQHPIQGKELPNDLPAHKSPEQSTAGLDEETSSLPDDQHNPESEKCNYSSEDTSGKIGSGYVENTIVQLHEDLHMDPIQGKELPNDLSAPKSPEQSTAGQDAKTLALPDEQSKPELKGGELKEHNISSEDTSGNVFQSHEDSHMDPTPGKELPDNLPAPESPEQSTAGQDAETSASPDELPSPELDSSEFEERNLSSEDTSSIVGTGYGKTNLFHWHEDPNQGKELPDNVPAPKSPLQSTSGQDAETSAWSDEQLNPKLEMGEFGELNFSNKDTSGQDAETSVWSDEQVNPKLDAGEFMEHNFSSEDMHEYSHMDPIQGKQLPNYLPADKSPKQSTIGYDENALGSDDEKFDPELEDAFSDEHNDDQTTGAMLSSGMTKPTLIEGSGSGMALPSAAGTPASTFEQPDSKLEGNEERSRCFDADNSYISDTGLMENDNLPSLPEDFFMRTFFGHELSVVTPAAKSSGESVVFQDNSVPGSVGTCQTSGRRRIEEISTKLLSFKISSAVKSSYIAMESAKTKQGDIPRPISLLRDMENVPATNPDHPAELNTDLLDLKDSPRQGTPDGL